MADLTTLVGRIRLFDDTNVRTQVRAALLKAQGSEIKNGNPPGPWVTLNPSVFVDDAMKALIMDDLFVKTFETAWAQAAAQSKESVNTEGFASDDLIEALVTDHLGNLKALH